LDRAITTAVSKESPIIDNERNIKMLRRSNYLKILCTSALLALSTLAMAQDKPASVLITNVMVWDGTSEERVAADILIEDNIITL
jgi:hypothetical protein